jgi:hypothetical protein
MRRYLVVANQTLGQPKLIEEIAARMETGPCTFHLLVPATHANDRDRWTPAEARALARRRLDAALTRFRELGANVYGEVGDPSPMVAIGEVLRHHTFDGLILSTLPPGPSRWLRQDLPKRVEQVFHLPVTLVTAVKAPAAGAVS